MKIYQGSELLTVRIADAKRQFFFVHSPHDTQYRSVLPKIYRGIKVRSQW